MCADAKIIPYKISISIHKLPEYIAVAVPVVIPHHQVFFTIEFYVGINLIHRSSKAFRADAEIVAHQLPVLAYKLCIDHRPVVWHSLLPNHQEIFTVESHFHKAGRFAVSDGHPFHRPLRQAIGIHHLDVCIACPTR